MNIQEQAEEFGVKYSYTVKMAFPAHKIAFNACLMRAFKDGYLAALAAKEQAKPEAGGLPAHYTPISEPSYTGRGNHSVMQLEQIADDYKELVHQLRIKNHSLEEKAKEESIAFAEWVQKNGYSLVDEELYITYQENK